MVKEYKGYTIAIEQDVDSESPRDWDNLGTIVYRHRDYKLGDKEIPEYYINNNGDSIAISTLEDVKWWIDNEYGKVAVILPLKIYEHSGITMYIGDTHDRWDGSAVGYIFVTKETVRKEYNVKRVSKKLLQKIENILRQEVKTYDQYLRGDVYYYCVTDENNKQIDSCGGFYDYNYMLETAHEAIDCHIKELERQKEEKLKAYIKNSVPLQYRTF